MHRIRLLVVTLAAIVASGFAAVPAAQASAWKCRTSGQYSVCLRTDRLDASHISGANIQATKTGAGCVNARLHHGTRLGDGSWLQIWSDNGAFQICQNQTRSFYWTHAGAGAYIPPNSHVHGFMQVADNRYYSPPIPRSEI